jgi:hypothetical protein
MTGEWSSSADGQEIAREEPLARRTRADEIASAPAVCLYRRTIIKLGGLGSIVGCDIDTAHFSGNEYARAYLAAQSLSQRRANALPALQVSRQQRLGS